VEASFGVPREVQEGYRSAGITSLFPWQSECLGSFLRLSGSGGPRHLTYSAPTGSGKTMVAEMLLARSLAMNPGSRALFVVPFVAMAREKARWFSEVLPYECAAFYTSEGSDMLLETVEVCVCTIERANLVLNKLLESDRAGALSCVVVDELHMVGDGQRGPVLEMMLSKLKLLEARGQAHPRLTIVSMSATVPNLGAIAQWLGAHVFVATDRPVPLAEFYVASDPVARRADGSVARQLAGVPPGSSRDDKVAFLVQEAAEQGLQSLVFCSSREHCARVAGMIAERRAARAQFAPGERQSDLMAELRDCPFFSDAVLSRAVPLGVAYHHAGLTVEERSVIEGGYRSGAIECLCATSTLAAGVNLPAGRVIFHGFTVAGSEVIDPSRYRQMAGRAGRPGLVAVGESYVVLGSERVEQVQSVIPASPDPVHSGLSRDNVLLRPVLEAVATGLVRSRADLDTLLGCTLLRFQSDLGQAATLGELTDAAIRGLQRDGLLLHPPAPDEWCATRFGRACIAAGLSPLDASFIKSEAEHSLARFNMTNELHAVYLIVPPRDLEIRPTFRQIRDALRRLSSSDKSVADVCGVCLDLANQWVNRTPLREDMRDVHIVRHQRFYAALVLRDLIRGDVTASDVSEAFGLNMGSIQALQERAASFARAMVTFSNTMGDGWLFLALVAGALQDRVRYGVGSQSLAELTRVEGVHNARARVLAAAGIHSVRDLAQSQPARIKAILLAAAAKVPGHAGMDPEAQDRILQSAARKICTDAKRLLAEELSKMRVTATTLEEAITGVAATTTTTTTTTTTIAGAGEAVIEASSFTCRASAEETILDLDVRRCSTPDEWGALRSHLLALQTCTLGVHIEGPRTALCWVEDAKFCASVLSPGPGERGLWLRELWLDPRVCMIVTSAPAASAAVGHAREAARVVPVVCLGPPAASEPAPSRAALALLHRLAPGFSFQASSGDLSDEPGADACCTTAAALYAGTRAFTALAGPTARSWLLRLEAPTHVAASRMDARGVGLSQAACARLLKDMSEALQRAPAGQAKAVLRQQHGALVELQTRAAGGAGGVSLGVSSLRLVTTIDAATGSLGYQAPSPYGLAQPLLEALVPGPGRGRRAFVRLTVADLGWRVLMRLLDQPADRAAPVGHPSLIWAAIACGEPDASILPLFTDSEFNLAIRGVSVEPTHASLRALRARVPLVMPWLASATGGSLEARRSTPSLFGTHAPSLNQAWRVSCNEVIKSTILQISKLCATLCLPADPVLHSPDSLLLDVPHEEAFKIAKELDQQIPTLQLPLQGIKTKVIQ
jgi:replicative superfamily II helicase